MNITLSLHSSPRFSTWVWLGDWRTLVDAGDGATQHLGYKIRKIDTVFCTHAHRDHIGGLLQVINQRGEAGGFALAHPCGSRSFSEMASFSLKFNPGTSHQAIWHALEEGDSLETGVEGRFLRAFRTKHYADDRPSNAPRSLGLHAMWRKAKVPAALRELPQGELDALRRQKGRDAAEILLARGEGHGLSPQEHEAWEAQLGREAITEPVDEKWVTVGGDGQPLSPEEARGTQLLLHEATFLSPEDYDAEDAGEDVGHVHSTVADALRVAHEAQVPNVVLYHISTRYTDTEIKAAVREVAEGLRLQARVWAAMPRRVHWDILREKPLYQP
jgi:ribonuclease Z